MFEGNKQVSSVLLVHAHRFCVNLYVEVRRLHVHEKNIKLAKSSMSMHMIC